MGIQNNQSHLPISSISISTSNNSTPSDIHVKPDDSEYGLTSNSSIPSIFTSRESFDNETQLINNPVIVTPQQQTLYKQISNDAECILWQGTPIRNKRIGDYRREKVEAGSGTELYTPSLIQPHRGSIGKSKLMTDEASDDSITMMEYERNTSETRIGDDKINPSNRNETLIDDSLSVGWLIITISILFWYFTSMTITALNKWLFDNLHFTYPLFVTFIHFTIISLFLQIGFSYCRSFCSIFPQVSRKHYFQFIVPIALFGASEIALSNLAYSMVSLSVMTVIKSSLVVVTYLVSVCFGLERFSVKLLSIVIFIMASISLTVPGLEIRNGFGVLVLGIAVVLAALRWTVVHHQLQRQNFKPLQLMVLTQPLSSVFLAPPAAAIDVRRLVEVEADSPDVQRLLAAVALICFTVVLAFLVIFAEYNLVRVTSSVSLTVAGIGKEIATIIMSILLFGERIDFVPSIGIGCSIVGIVLYSRLRINRSQELKDLQRIPSHDFSRPPSLNTDSCEIDPLQNRDGIVINDDTKQTQTVVNRVVDNLERTPQRVIRLSPRSSPYRKHDSNLDSRILSTPSTAISQNVALTNILGLRASPSLSNGMSGGIMLFPDIAPKGFDDLHVH